MAQPSSSHHGERHHRSERERERESRHHHNRTISSTTLLLVLSLVLAVLAVMLSLPATSGSDSTSGVMGYLTPKRTQALIARESAVAVREAEVARREAELLAGAPGGVVAPSPSPVAPVLCPVCTPTTITETISLPAQTIIKEIVKEDSLTPPGWSAARTEELLEREHKIAERERDISKREENVNRREHDAARRESWIMEQLMGIGNDVPQTVEEEYIYEPAKRKPKLPFRELPIASEYEPKIVIQTQTVTMQPPANTRLAASPIPNAVTPTTTPSTPRTTAIEIVEEEKPRTVLRAPKRQPTRWFGAW